MQRRDFLRFAVLTPLAAAIPLVHAAASKGPAVEPLPDGKHHRFELSHQHFLLDGVPFQIRSGEMHPARIPAEHWLHRIRMAKAMGLNTIAIYLMWNYFESEPGIFDLTTERRDFVRFIKLCQQEGMWVYLRPGPYVCAEWDLGGLPAYLLRDPTIRVRTKDDPRYMQAVQRYMDAIAPRLVPLMASQGGPILMMQIENEYASFGHDLDYLLRLKAMWQAHGIDGPFSVSDGLGQIEKAKTYVPGAALGLDGDTDFIAAQSIAGEAPVWMGEGYPGWLTHWGDPAFQIGDFTATLRQLLAEGRSFNMYVVHGGTNFGYSAGANAHNDYSGFEPVITSYDYGAPINERGEATPEYHIFRKLIAAHVAHVPEPPPAPPTIHFADVVAKPFASIWDNLPPGQHVTKPNPNEMLFAQDHGMVVYSKTLQTGGMLHIEGLRDYGTIFTQGQYLDYLSRVNKPGLHVTQHVDIPPPANGAGAVLDILVDSFGHVGYGEAIYDFKGIVGAVTLDGEEMKDWQAHSLPLDETYIAGLPPMRDTSISKTRPGMFFKASIELEQLGDCYIDMSAWDKGYVWVNGQMLGRYWRIGPQQRLYCPVSWFKRGHNELLVFDMHRVSAASIRSSDRLIG